MRVYNLRSRTVNSSSHFTKLAYKSKTISRRKIKEKWILKMDQPLLGGEAPSLLTTPGAILDTIVTLEAIGAEPPVGTSSPHPFNTSITPLGAGINHTIIGLQPLEPSPLTSMDEAMANSILDNIQFEMDGLDDLSSRQGWIGDLERHVTAIEKQLLDHKVDCITLGFKDIAERTAQTMKNLRAIANRLRAKAGLTTLDSTLTTTDTTTTATATSVATTVSNTLPLPGNISEFPSFDQEEDALSRVRRMRKKLLEYQKLHTDESTKLRGELETIKPQLAQLQTDLASVKDDQRFVDILKRLDTVEQNFSQVNSLAQNNHLQQSTRIAALENTFRAHMMTSRFKDQQVQQSISALEQDVNVLRQGAGAGPTHGTCPTLGSTQPFISLPTILTTNTAGTTSSLGATSQNIPLQASTVAPLVRPSLVTFATASSQSLGTVVSSFSRPDISTSDHRNISKSPETRRSPSTSTQDSHNNSADITAFVHDSHDDNLFDQHDNLDELNSELRESSYELKQQLTPSIAEIKFLGKDEIVKIHTNLKRIEDQQGRLQDRTDRLDRSLIDPAVRKYISSTLRTSTKWANTLVKRYNELDCSRRPLDKKFHSNLKRFSRHSDINVFEFLENFEHIVEDAGGDKERGELLFKSYLDYDLQDEIRSRRKSYKLMRDWLISEVGDAKTMTRNILAPLSKLKLPTDQSTASETCTYYRKLQSCIQKLSELKDTKSVPLDRVAEHIHSSDNITRIVNLLPKQTKTAFLNHIGIPIQKAEGKEVFSDLVSLVNKHFTSSKSEESAALIDSGSVGTKPKRQPSTSTKPANLNHVNNTKTESKDKTAKKTKHKFPCPIDKHDHELGVCQKFFSLGPRDRGVAAKKKLCYCCLGPAFKCRSKCNNEDRVSQLICPECKDWAVANDKRPRNMLLCTQSTHTHLNNADITVQLKKYLENFDPDKLKNKEIKQAQHVFVTNKNTNCITCHNITCNCNVVSKSGKVTDSLIPSYNTISGSSVDIPDSLVRIPPEGDPFYIMQILSIGGQDVLTFFDSGANQNLIDGEIGEMLCKVISRRPNNIGTAGGGTVNSCYGTYGFRLGPDNDGMYHEIIAQGILQVTQSFDKFDLSEIIQEALESPDLDLGDCHLPEHIGGSKAHLILGIKDLAIMPKLLCVLPSGVGVWKSPFVDRWGSDICFGGPHPTFSSNNNNHHIHAYFTHLSSTYRNSLYPWLAQAITPDIIEGNFGLCYLKDTQIDADPTLQTDHNPTPVGDYDLVDLGSLEEPIIDDPSDVCTCSDSNDTHNCPIQVFKSHVPASKRKQYLDQDEEVPTSVRCSKCEACQCRMLSAREKMQSIQEKVEQDVISRSVRIDTENNKTIVSLPFIRPPIEALSKRHYGRDSNYSQAFRIFQSQCRGTPALKAEVLQVKDDLVEKQFIRKLSDLSPEQQQLVNTAAFKHYLPWRAHYKPGSTSTRCRLVVDASCTGINDCLAKGENNIGTTLGILIRNRCHKHIFCSDISKMYNRMQLDDSALPFCLVLFSDSLDIDTLPDTYVMLVAWYGLTPTGNQAGEAMQKLAEMFKDSLPLAFLILLHDRFVDDLLSGGLSYSQVSEMIDQVQKVLDKGGFQLKYVIRSGEAPAPEASFDGTSVTVLGYKWSTADDYLQINFGEINFQKRRRGEKPPNPFPVVTEDDVLTLLDSTKISRRMVIAKISELYDPCGLFEPFKVILKLDSKQLAGQDWDSILPAALQQLWTKHFCDFLTVPNMIAKRWVGHPDAVDPTSFRLLCLSDAGEACGGAAIYASQLLPDGSYSCQLLISKSKLLGGSVPRNELEGILIMAKLAVTVKDALYQFNTEFLFFTDSSIALCWSLNPKKKLKLYTANRVSEIRSMLQYCSGSDSEDLPLYHISGKLNVADLLTKRHSLLPKDLGPGSLWQSGYPWMKLPIDQMPITRFTDISLSHEENLSADQECFPEFLLSNEIPKGIYHFQAPIINPDIVHCEGCPGPALTVMAVCYGVSAISNHCNSCVCTPKPAQIHAVSGIEFTKKSAKSQRFLPLEMDLIKHGWMKSIKALATVLRTVSTFIHKCHLKKGVDKRDNCPLCTALETSAGDKAEAGKIFRILAKDYLFRKESSRLKLLLSKKNLAKYHEKAGILYLQSRLSEENPVSVHDLDFTVFFDSAEIHTFLPVVSATSALFFSYAMFVHEFVKPHSGVHRTMREIVNLMYAIDNGPQVIQKIRNDCSKCRRIDKKTLDLAMAQHHPARTTIAPAYYNVQADVVFGFRGQRFKGARGKTYPLYALCLVCLLTSASAIYCLEGLETQDVVQALERHTSRYGAPFQVFCDSGTQLVALQNTKFQLRDVNAVISDMQNTRVRVTTPQSHVSNGRVEAKIKILRQSIEKTFTGVNMAQTPLSWETLFSKIASQMDDVPISRSNSSSVNDPGWGLITPNRLKLGRNSFRSLEGSIMITKGSGDDKLLRRNHEIQQFWYDTFLSHIHALIPQPNKWHTSDSLAVGDIVLFTHTESSLGNSGWKIGRVVSIPDKSKVVIEYPSNKEYGEHGLKKLSTLVRSPRNISVIHRVEELDLNSNAYHQSLQI